MPFDAATLASLAREAHVERVRVVGPWTVVARCAASQSVLADGVLDTIAGLAGHGKGVAPGVTVQFGISTLRLVADGDRLVVHEPDYAGIPQGEAVPGLTTTLAILAAQVPVLRKLGVPGREARFDDKVVMRRGALDCPKVYMERSKPKRGDSGWYLGPVDGPDGPLGVDELEACYVHDLVTRRPALLQALALPPGFLVVFDGDAIESVLDPQDEDRW